MHFLLIAAVASSIQANTLLAEFATSEPIPVPGALIYTEPAIGTLTMTAKKVPRQPFKIRHPKVYRWGKRGAKVTLWTLEVGSHAAQILSYLTPRR